MARKSELSEQAYQRKLEYNREYRQRKDVKERNVKYNIEYKKKNYINKGIFLKEDENKMLSDVLEKYNLSLKEYIMKKVEEDLK